MCKIPKKSCKIGRKSSKQEKPQAESLLEGQERHSSSLLRHLIIKKRRQKSGLIGRQLTVLLKSLKKNGMEFRKEVESGTKYSQMDELGDVLFTIVNISRFLKLSPEEAMVHANQKFKSRFSFVEKSVKDGHGQVC